MNNSTTSALRVALIYVIFAAAWILFSDSIVEAVFGDQDLIAEIQTYKGLAFVIITALMLFTLVLRNNYALDRANDTDALTGLYNINLFIRSLDLKIKELKPNERLVLGYLDIDDFRMINESIGFERADELLKDLALHFEQATLHGSVVARMQADQFASFNSFGENLDMEAHVRGIQIIFDQRCRHFGINATCSLGIALYPIDGRTPKELMVAATDALGIAKETKNAIQFHDKAMTEKALQRRQMIIDLQKAISSEQLTVVYQPKYTLSDQVASGVEVLVRWNHGQHGFISPDIFIPLAEENGLSSAISKLVVKKSSQELGQSGLLGNKIKHVAVNVSATEFNNADKMYKLTQFILTQSTLATCMRIEITETATLNDMKKSLSIISNLQASGLTFSVDDFGTGYTSLAMLKDLTVDEIKIDRSFVSEIEHDPRSRTIVNAIIAMAKSFNINVVAEGVETAEQLQALKAMGCQEAQGYYLGRPMPIKDLVLHLQN
ncbi:putative bifunctional diguanylate cyclase/phosphodiesterase [Paraglaciecola hydrolytica]|uniref:Diguanylate phosphodiesterase n=1 Tax=Paraglaciecola hydrolytica TaxID=1799789 RepID=A0A135ZYY2_9ALTE|nr:bifunctional diguanylate cyclase/phosphodiesterase [Paraglaciecola hydrolytica]KXI28192.1 diguanylate phosphodiesterase [Paraglaciecola hydrolytica]